MMGDYNSYAMEDPITTIKNAGFTNLIESFLGPDAYSYVFDGQWGYLDHALGSASSRAQVTGVGDYHINADEPSVLDYNTDFKTANLISSLYAPDQFRISDHDPVVVGLTPVNAWPAVTAAFSKASVSCGADTAALNVTFTDPIPPTRTSPWSTGETVRRNKSSPATSPLSLAHTYAKAGRYTATITVTDDNGNAGIATADVTVDTRAAASCRRSIRTAPASSSTAAPFRSRSASRTATAPTPRTWPRRSSSHSSGGSARLPVNEPIRRQR